MGLKSRARFFSRGKVPVFRELDKSYKTYKSYRIFAHDIQRNEITDCLELKS